MEFNPTHQYGDVIFIPKECWPLSNEDKGQIVKFCVDGILSIIPKEYQNKIRYFMEPPPEIEFYSKKDPLIAENFNKGFFSWKYSGKSINGVVRDETCERSR